MSSPMYHWPNIQSPKAQKIPFTITTHNDSRDDPYYWMNDYFKKGQLSETVLDNLKDENRYIDDMMADTKELQTGLFKEMKNRIKERDQSVPVLINGYYYYTKYEEGKEYEIYCRKKESLTAPEEVILDVNILAANYEYYDVSGLSISPNSHYIVFGVDNLSRKLYKLMIKDLRSNIIIEEEQIDNTADNYVWSNDSLHIYYVEKNTETLLTESVKRHRLGNTMIKQDVTLYFEKDSSNFLGIEKTKSKQYILLSSSATLSTEIWYLEANNPLGDFKLFQARRKDIIYFVEHHNDYFIVFTNWHALNFKVMRTPLDKTECNYWQEWLIHKPDTLLENINVFKSFVVLTERSNGLLKIKIMNLISNSEFYIDFEEPAYDVNTISTPAYDSSYLRYSYTSLTTPVSVYEYNMETQVQKLLKRQEIIGGYDPMFYQTERIFATATDGITVPISLVYNKKYFKKFGQSPLLLYGYGSYGSSLDAGFNSNRISLLDRGFTFAIAHVRGGEELGRKWYEDGKLKNKKNTFTDFIACAEKLIKEGYVTKEHLYIQGGSAGGLLIGTTINMRPDLFRGAIAQVPFVDVVTTMLDTSIPLTTNEFDEWGNPIEKVEDYLYMKSYSPYDNVEKKEYPNLLVTTGLHDSQVQYFEPQKWVAKLRDYKIGNSVILFHTNLSVGHNGASGRFDYLKEIALNYSFLIKLEALSNSV
ncbi:MAG: S9 family peptidase [Phycisphaerales bacterium]|nr:S9 family peptidase [Phycisphaerales bacterium]